MSTNRARPPGLTRRALLSLGAWRLAAAPRAAAAALALGAPWTRPAAAHGALGPVTPPRVVPPLTLTLHDGRVATLPALLRGRITALQLMFTGCSASCPVQGAVFAALQGLVLGSLPAARLLSLSIDPVGDDAQALAAWRQRFGAAEGWLAAAPPVKHAEAMLDFVEGRPPAGRVSDRHNAQVFLFDAQGRLAYRLAEFAAPRDIARAMVELSRSSA
jgi:protein SCO1/2